MLLKRVGSFRSEVSISEIETGSKTTSYLIRRPRGMPHLFRAKREQVHFNGNQINSEAPVKVSLGIAGEPTMIDAGRNKFTKEATGSIHAQSKAGPLIVTSFGSLSRTTQRRLESPRLTTTTCSRWTRQRAWTKSAWRNQGWLGTDSGPRQLRLGLICRRR